MPIWMRFAHCMSFIYAQILMHKRKMVRLFGVFQQAAQLYDLRPLFHPPQYKSTMLHFMGFYITYAILRTLKVLPCREEAENVRQEYRRFRKYVAPFP